MRWVVTAAALRGVEPAVVPRGVAPAVAPRGVAAADVPGREFPGFVVVVASPRVVRVYAVVVKALCLGP